LIVAIPNDRSRSLKLVKLECVKDRGCVAIPNDRSRSLKPKAFGVGHAPKGCDT